MNELPAEVNESDTPLNAFATSVTGLESHLSVKLIEARRERMRYDVFLSHAGADKPEVERLAKKGSRPPPNRSHRVVLVLAGP